MTALGDHAIAELDYQGIIDPDRALLITIVGTFAEFDDDVIPEALTKVEQLLRFKPLTDLTNEPGQWTDRSDDGAVPVVHGQKIWQSKRDPDAWTYDPDFGSYFLLSQQNTGEPSTFPTEEV